MSPPKYLAFPGNDAHIQVPVVNMEAPGVENISAIAKNSLSLQMTPLVQKEQTVNKKVIGQTELTKMFPANQLIPPPGEARGLFRKLVDTIEGIQRNLEEANTRLGNRLDQIVTTIAELDQKMTALDQKVVTIDRKLTPLDRKVARLDQRVTTFVQNMTTLDRKVTRIGVGVEEVQRSQKKSQILAYNAGAAALEALLNPNQAPNAVRIEPTLTKTSLSSLTLIECDEILSQLDIQVEDNRVDAKRNAIAIALGVITEVTVPSSD